MTVPIITDAKDSHGQLTCRGNLIRALNCMKNTGKKNSIIYAAENKENITLLDHHANGDGRLSISSSMSCHFGGHLRFCSHTHNDWERRKEDEEARGATKMKTTTKRRGRKWRCSRRRGRRGTKK